MTFQRAAGDGPSLFAGNDHGGIGCRHLLGRHVEDELRRRELEQCRVQFGNEGANIVLQRTLDGDRNHVRASGRSSQSCSNIRIRAVTAIRKAVDQPNNSRPLAPSTAPNRRQLFSSTTSPKPMVVKLVVEK